MATVVQKHPLEWLARSGYAARGYSLRHHRLDGTAGRVRRWRQNRGQQREHSKVCWASRSARPYSVSSPSAFIGYVAWRATQAIRDTDDHGTDAKGLAVRGGLAVSAVTHTLLAVFAISLIIGSGGGGGDGGTQDWTVWLMRQPFGRWLVAIVGIAVAGAGSRPYLEGLAGEVRKALHLERR